MKFMILLALLGVASATIYGSHFYPEHQQFWGPYRHLYGQEGIHQYPWYKYGQTWPWSYHKTFPYMKEYSTYPYTHSEYTYVPTVPHVAGHLPSVWAKYPWLWNTQYPSVWNKNIYPLDVTVTNHISTYPTVEKYQHLYPYGEHIYKPYISGQYIPRVAPVVPHVPSVVPHVPSVVPQYEHFPYFHKSWETPVSTILPTVEGERFVGLPTVHEELPVYTPRFEKYMPSWFKYFGAKPVVPYHHETSGFLPSYYRPYHYGLY